MKFVLLSLLVPLLLCQCSLLPGAGGESVIYALAPQEALPSPLEQPLTSAAPPVVFARDRYDLSSRQQEALKPLAAQWQQDSTPLLILGFAKRGLPTDYARSLSQRRAEAVREALINEGLDAALLHSAGYGHDQPKLSSGDEVRIFSMPAPAPTPAASAAPSL